MRTIQETAAWNGNRGPRFRDMNVDRQLRALMRELGANRAHPHRRVAHRTIQTREGNLRSFIDTLRKAGHPLRSLLNLEERHILRVVEVWTRNGDQPGTIVNRLTAVRWMAEALAKPGMVRSAAYYGVDAGAARRAAAQDKSWANHEVVSIDIVKKATELDARVGMQLDLMRVFGLSVIEAVLIVPWQSDRGSFLSVENGAPGGKARVVHIRTDEQRRVLNAATILAESSHPDKRLQRPGEDLTQSLNRFYYITGKKLGITKAKLGVTPHGLRADFVAAQVHHQDKTANLEGAAEGADATATAAEEATDA